MTGQTVSGAVAVRAKQDQLVDWVRTQQDEIAMVAASHIKPSAIVRVAHGALRRNEKLMAAAVANPQSLMYALLDAARLGHEPDTDDYYLVPFGGEVTGIEGYKGIVERMFRAGAVDTVVAEVVRQNDVYSPRGSTTPPRHEYDDFADPESRGALRGVYAYAIFLSGRGSQVIRMGRAEVMEHKAKSRGSHKDDSPWQQWEPAMWKKCALRGLEPYVPTSTEYRNGVTARSPVHEIADGDTYAVPSGAPAGSGVVLQAVPEPEAPAAPQASRPAARGTTAASRPEGGTRPRSRPSDAALEKLGDLLRQVPPGTPEEVAVWLGWVTGHAAVEELTAADCAAATRSLTAALKAADGHGELAAGSIWTAWHEAHPEGAPGGNDAAGAGEPQ